MRRVVVVGFLFFLTLFPALAELPYAEHGWSKEEASAHLLSRLTFGARPREAERVAQMGLERWFEEQLAGVLPDQALQTKLEELPPAYRLDNIALLETYPRPVQIRKMAEEAGIIKEGDRPTREDRMAVLKLLKEKGMRPFQEAGVTLFAQKLLHARHSENSLREVLTDFWFNHFNVALSNNRASMYILSYERDVIRPNALGNFRTLLGATAKHPAMLLYLDNANSTAGKEAVTTMESRMDAVGADGERARRVKQRVARRKKGLNENYARELMELHTLGVDGGYTQEDVVEVARAFTGWTVNGPRVRQATKNRGAMSQAMGNRQEGDFFFAAPIHDAGSKTILGHRFAPGGGMEEGERVLDLLVAHPSTADHLAQKLAVRFISDEPATEDVEQIARAFQDSRGDIKEVMRAVVRTDGFWDKENRQAKVKSPFEYVVSASRALGGELFPSRQLYGWLAKMGQPVYNYQAPTGFPDQADFWVSSATVLNRVNFGLQAATGGVPGFTYPPQASVNVKSAVSRLLPYHADAQATEQNVNAMLADAKNLNLEAITQFEVRPNLGGRFDGRPVPRLWLKPEEKEAATMIGLILGTPEFQRR